MYKPILSIGGGTGVLVGRRHFITAAHLVYDWDEDNQEMVYTDPRVRFGRNGRRSIGFRTRIKNVFAFKSWRTGDLSGTREFSKDLVWGVLRRRSFRCVDYYGFFARTVASIEENRQGLQDVGYPSCRRRSRPNPPGCTSNRMYQDSSNCEVLGRAEKDSENWSRAIHHGCDTNPGHSGSPLIITEDGGNYVWGVHVGAIWGDNYGARLTPSRSEKDS